MYAYAHAILDDEPIKLTRFPSVDKLLLSTEVFMSLKIFQSFYRD